MVGGWDRCKCVFSSLIWGNWGAGESYHEAQVHGHEAIVEPDREPEGGTKGEDERPGYELVVDGEEEHSAL